jgi:RHS repeat-associated protein
MSRSAKRFAVRRREVSSSARTKRRAKLPDFEPLENRRLLTIAFRSSIGIAGPMIETDGVATDSAGNTYVTGSFAGTSNFSPTPSSIPALTSNGQTDIFVAKYSPSGGLLWAENFGGPTADQGKGITLDASGNVYVTGSFSGQVTFSPGAVLTSLGPANTFVLKLNSSGAFQWVQQIQGVASQAQGATSNAGAGIVGDSLNHVDVVGTFTGSATFGPTISTQGASSVYLASLSTATGSEVLFEAINGSGSSQAGGIAFYPGSNVLALTGSYTGTITYSTTQPSLVSAGGDDALLADISASNFSMNWMRTMGGVGEDTGNAVAFDPYGDIYITGSFEGTVNFDPTKTYNFNANILTSAGGDNAFVARFHSGGVYAWSRGILATGASKGMAVVADLSGVYVGGWFAGTATPDPAQTDYYGGLYTGPLDSGPGLFSLRSSGEISGFIAQLGLAGDFVYALQFGGSGQAAALGMSSIKLPATPSGTGNLEVVGRADWTAGFVPSSIARGGSSAPAGDSPMGFIAHVSRSVTIDDYDGDGLTDFSVYTPNSSQWYAQLSARGLWVSTTTSQLPLLANMNRYYDIPVSGDFDGDGKTDYGYFDTTTATWYIVLSSKAGQPGGAANLVFQFGTPWPKTGLGDIPITGDFDGDGKTDFGVFNPVNAQWIILYSSGGTNANPVTHQFPTFGQAWTSFFQPGDIPVVGDYDGDGKSDYGVFRPSTPQWFVQLSSGGVLRDANHQTPVYGAPWKSFDQPGGIPIAGDFDGDGKSDLAYYTPSTDQFAYNLGGATNFVPSVPNGDDWDFQPNLVSVPTSTSIGSLVALRLVPAQGVGTFSLPDIYINSIDTNSAATSLAVVNADQNWHQAFEIVRPNESNGSSPNPVTVYFNVTPDAGVSASTSFGANYSPTPSTIDYQLSLNGLPGSAPTMTLSQVNGVFQGSVLLGPGKQAIVYVNATPNSTQLGKQGGFDVVLEQNASYNIHSPNNLAKVAIQEPLPGNNNGDGTGVTTGTTQQGTGGTAPGQVGGDGGTSGTTSGGSTNSSGSNSNPTGPTVTFAPGISESFANADYLSTSESPLGITDGPVWVNASSGDVQISPSVLTTRGSGYLPAWEKNTTLNPVIQINWTTPSNVLISAFDVTLVVGPASQQQRVSEHFAVSETYPSTSVAFAIPVGNAPLPTGLWSWQLLVSVTPVGISTSVPDTVPYVGQTEIINRNASALGSSFNPYGQGWWIPGLDQLVPSQDPNESGYSWVRSDGTAAWFQQGTNSSGGVIYTGPKGSFVYLSGSATTGWTLTGPNGLEEDFYPNGLLEDEKDRNNNLTSFAYTSVSGDSLGDAISTITDPFRRTVSFQYDQSGHLATVTDHAGTAGARSAAITFASSTDQLTGINIANSGNLPGMNLVFVYSTNGVITSIGLPDNRQMSIGYDSKSNIATSVYHLTQSGSNFVSLSHWSILTPRLSLLASAMDPNKAVSVYTDPNGNVTTYSTDAYGYVLAAINAMGVITSYNRNADGLVTQVFSSAPNGAAAPVPKEQTSFTYNDQFGRLTSETLPDGSVESWTYNSPVFNPSTGTYTGIFDTPTTFTDPNQGTDSNSHTTTYTLDSHGNVTAVTDPMGNVTQYSYNSAGMLTSMTQPDPDGNGPLTSQVTTFTYDSTRGNLISTVTLPDGSTEQYSYNADDDLVTLTDNRDAPTGQPGRVTTYTYDALDQLIEEDAPASSGGSSLPPPVTQFQYDGTGDLTQETDPAPFPGSGAPVTQYQYNPLGELQAVLEPSPTTGAAAPQITYTYDLDRNVTSVSDELGRVTKYTYDSLNELTAEVDAAGGTTRFDYDRIGRLLAKTDPLGNTSEATYDPRNRMVSQTDALGNTNKFAYDNVGNLTSETDALGNTTSYKYNADNELIQVTEPDPDGSGPLPAPVYSYSYDALGRITSITGIAPGGSSSLGAPVTNISYSAPNLHQVTVQDPAPDGNPSHAPTTIYQYNARGDVVSVTDPMNGQPGFSNDITTYKYDNIDQLVQETDPAPSANQPSPVKQWNYDNEGNLTGELDTNANGTGNTYQVTYQYDSLNRLVNEIDATGTITHAYDAAGQETGTTDQLGHTTNYSYDSLGELTQEIDPSQDGVAARPTTNFGYDANGDQVFTTDPTGGLTVSNFDPLGQETMTTDPDGNTVHTTYNANGDVSSITDSVGNKTSYTRDNLGRVISEAVSYNPNPTTYKYDAAGNLVQTVDRDGHTINRFYDNLGQETSEQWMNGSSVAKTISFAYDLDGNLLSASDNTAASLIPALSSSAQAITDSFTNDALGRELTDSQSFHGMTSPFVLSSNYDSLDNLTSLSDGLGGQSTYTYDSAQRLQSASMSVNNVLGPQVSLTYNAASLVTGITRQFGSSGPQITSALQYNNDNQLTQITHTNGASNSTIAQYGYQYDKSGRVTTETETNYQGATETHNFTYDPAGQLKSETIGTAAPTSYSYDANGNRKSVTNSSGTNTTASLPGNELQSDNNYNYTYDAEGNLINQTAKSGTNLPSYVYVYDDANELVQTTITASNGSVQNVVIYTYDPLGRRVAVTVEPGGNASNATTTWTVYNGDTPYADLTFASATATTPNVVSRYLSNPDDGTVYARFDANATSAVWYLTDALGSVRVLATSSTSTVGIVDRVDYDAFGDITNETNATGGDRFKYAGGQFDPVTGLYYDGARYYSPAIGRFLTQDPSGFGGGDPNVYRYVQNGPINGTDPTGLREVPQETGPSTDVAQRTGSASPNESQSQAGESGTSGTDEEMAPEPSPQGEDDPGPNNPDIVDEPEHWTSTQPFWSIGSYWLTSWIAELFTWDIPVKNMHDEAKVTKGAAEQKLTSQMDNSVQNDQLRKDAERRAQRPIGKSTAQVITKAEEFVAGTYGDAFNYAALPRGVRPATPPESNVQAPLLPDKEKAGGKSAGASALAKAPTSGPSPPLATGNAAREILRNNLGSNPYPVPAQAHHIFPVKEFNTPLGQRLHGFGIDLNGSDNGVLLPTTDYPGRKASIHRGSSGPDYVKDVIDRLNRAKSRKAALEVLQDIKQELLNGKLKINNAS